ncbi:cytochrome c oxidase subunit VII SCDLUD_001237 [Saccharomycodes ludwigii]|uniref:cytochrome c oxidase subunit VII n=1 Tax=Saccharomycodes ludwigii TaxID=36035 RepID=UPI001E881560|nr:hypothetical protein SCDLUD_001237 [Saccharomycodes ludwigii]KAH3903593.1 hypothetical protein SCDLUD_001237 [Saccharomycodes ludwigii]
MANHVIQLQKLYQSSTKPLWWRNPRSAFYMYPFWALFTFTAVAPFYWVGRMLVGKKADQ